MTPLSNQGSRQQPGSRSAAAVFICYNRCLYCGRRTNHEVCHQHSRALHPWGVSLPKPWRGFSKRMFYKPPEECADPRCQQLAVDWA